jgi:hypothetical protein
MLFCHTALCYSFQVVGREAKVDPHTFFDFAERAVVLSPLCCDHVIGIVQVFPPLGPSSLVRPHEVGQHIARLQPGVLIGNAFGCSVYA